MQPTYWQDPPPHNLKIRWGWTESILSRKTAKLIIYNDIVKSLRDWVQDVFFPEEFFFATLSTLDRGKLGEGQVDQGKIKNGGYKVFKKIKRKFIKP